MRKIDRLFLSTILAGSIICTNANPSFAAYESIDQFYSAIEAGNLQEVQGFVEYSRQLLAQSGQAADYQINLDFQDNYGNTPLMRAAAAGQYDVVNYLTNQNVKLNSINYTDQTATDLAYANGHHNIVRYLDSIGAYVSPQVKASLARAELAPAAETTFVEPEANTLPKSYYYAGAGIGVAALAGGIAAAAASGSGSDGGSSGGQGTPSDENPIQFGITDSGGTSGAGDTHPDSEDPNDFLVAEATSNEGYAAMNTQEAAARGYDGRIYVRDAATGLLINNIADAFVKVAVLDSGVDLNHADINGNILTANAVTCTTTSGCVSGGDDTEGHGTFVAGIIAAEQDGNNTGMHGIAPRAKIMPIKFLDVSDGSELLSIKYATDNGANIINGSYGLGVFGDDIPIVTPTDPGTGISSLTPGVLRIYLTTSENGGTKLQAYENMVEADIIAVFAAGNSTMSEVGIPAGLPYYFQGANPGGISGYDTVNPEGYDWSKNWVTVVSLDDSLSLSSFSNECGVAKNWCIAAPGEINRSLNMGGGYTSNNGTSFAAPNVSGAIAVMMGAFPHLEPRQILEIIFDTAQNLGAPGVDAIYGHGLIDLEAATSPSSGGWNIITGPSSFGFTSSGIRLSPAFGNALSESDLGLIFVDKYNKDYQVSLNSLVSNVTKPRESSLQKLSEFNDSGFSTNQSIGTTTTLAYSMTDENNGDEKYYNSEELQLSKLSFATTNAISEDAALTVKLNYRTNPSESFSYSPLAGFNGSKMLLSDAFKNPYLNFSDYANSYEVVLDTNQATLKFGSFKTEQDEFNYSYSDKHEMSGFFAEAGKNITQDFSASLTAGMNSEADTFLGSESGGAFNSGSDTSTYYIGMTGRLDVSDNFALFGNYNMGNTQVGMGKNSLFTNFSDVITDSFSIGGEYKNLYSGNDKFGFTISQPLRVMSATASLNLPEDILKGGEVVFKNSSLSLAPEGREVDLDAYYSFTHESGTDLAFGSSLRLNPDHNPENPAEAIFLFKAAQNF